LLVEDGPFKHIEDLDKHLDSWNTLYSIRDATLPVLYLGRMSDCRFENCKNMTEYISKIKDLPRQINTSGGAGGGMGCSGVSVEEFD
jgi:hypothetical protein